MIRRGRLACHIREGKLMWILCWPHTGPRALSESLVSRLLPVSRDAAGFPVPPGEFAMVDTTSPFQVPRSVDRDSGGVRRRQS